MGLMQEIEQVLKGAIRDKNENARNAVRLLLTAVKVKEKEIRRPLEDAEIRQVIASQIKQRRDSIEQYSKAGRQDLAQVEETEIGVLSGFLPEAMSTDELEHLVEEAVREVGAASIKEIGKVMKALIPRLEGRAEGKTVNELVRKRLSP